MSAEAASAGKTSPRLLQDLLCFDPRGPRKERNVLTDAPPYILEPHQTLKQISSGGCYHVFATKQEQSEIPSQDARADTRTKWRVASTCEKCRCHMTMTADFTSNPWKLWPCPNTSSPLHHFLFNSSISSESRVDAESYYKDPHGLKYRFSCSSPHCPAVLKITLRPPRLSEEYINLLTSDELLQKRYDAAAHSDPARRNAYNKTTRAQALSRMRTYINDSLDPAHTKRRIPTRNKVLITTFGQDCDGMLNSFGLRRVQSEEDGNEYWQLPPAPPPRTSAFEEDETRMYLEDVMQELKILLIRTLPESEIKDLPQHHGSLHSSSADLDRILGHYDYPTSPRSRRKFDLASEETTEYPNLGSLSDFADNLIEFAYDRQCACDPLATPYYFDSLETITAERNSESLQFKVATLASKGQRGQREIASACAYLGIDTRHLHVLSEDNIIGLFQSRLVDSSTSQEGELRQKLQVIGQAKQSSRILQAAETIETYSQALTFLGVEEATADDSVVAMYELKIGENPQDEALGKRAVQIIADKRDSEALRAWLGTGQVSDVSMSLDEAYIILGISDRNVDDQSLTQAFDIYCSDNPDRKPQYEKALRTIANDRGSEALHSYLLGGRTTFTMASIENKDPAKVDLPVGLAQAGNTCYLASILQLLFSLKPTRELLLHFDDHEISSETASQVDRVVGGATVTMNQVKEGQVLSEALGRLFQRMITHQYLSFRIPSDVCDCAMFKTGVTIPSKQPAVGLEKESPTAKEAADATEGQDQSSDATLINTPATTPSSKEDRGELLKRSPDSDEDHARHKLAKDANSHSHTTETKDDLMELSSTADAGDLPDPTASAPTVTNKLVTDNSEHASSPLSSAHSSVEDPFQLIKTPPQPQREAPVPPDEDQQGEQKGEQSLESTTAAGQERRNTQEDAGEGLMNILDKLQYALRPENIEDREQIDIIKRLFYGREAQILEKASGQSVTEYFFRTVEIPVWQGDTDVYEALDATYDPEEVELEGKQVPKYRSITQFPPILQLEAQRQELNMETGTYRKTDHYLRLHETIYMDRFIGGKDDEEILRKRKQSWAWKAELRQLCAARDQLDTTRASSESAMTLPDAIRTTANFIEQLQNDDNEVDSVSGNDSLRLDSSLPAALQAEALSLENRLQAMDDRKQVLEKLLENVWADATSIGYKLYACFVHRGSSGSSGHYWIWIRDFQSNVWRSYNDETVEVIDGQVPFTRPAPGVTPTYLIYVRDTEVENLTQPLCRNPDPIEAASTTIDPNVDKDAKPTSNEQDVEMTDQAPESQMSGVEETAEATPAYNPPKYQSTHGQIQW